MKSNNNSVLPDKLIEKLVCPDCNYKLDYRIDQNRLICHECKLAFKINDGIPVLLLDEAENI